MVGADLLRGRSELSLALPEPTYVEVELGLSRLHTAESAVAVRAWRAWSPALSALFVARRRFLSEPDAPWADVWRRRLADVRVRSRMCYTTACLELGGTELPGAERAARELLEAAPYRESGHLVLMRALAANGNVAEALTAPIRDFGDPLLVGLAPMPCSVLQTAFDALLPKGLPWYWKVDFFEQITDDAIAVNRRYGETMPTPLSTMHWYPISGAAARVPEDATAFAYRNGGWVGVIAGIDPDPANLPAAASWAEQYWQDLHASSAGGGHVNMMMEDDGQERVRAAYRGNYDRLVQIKRRYDSANLFHIDHNISPF